MPVRFESVRADQALAALARAVRSAQFDSPLAPVTVLVPTNATGVVARRWLGAHGGVAAIEMVTLARLAERLAGATLAREGRRPVSTPLIDITVRAVLRAAPGAFADVAQHPSTITSLRDLYRELRTAGPDSTTRLAASSARGRETARVTSMVEARLASGWYDEADLVTVATTALGGDTPHALGPVIAFLPRLESGLATDLLAEIGRRHDLMVLAEATGVDAVDAELDAFAQTLGTEVGHSPVEHPGATSPCRTETLSVTDSDDEVRHAVRLLVDAARDGTSFARMSVVWPTDRPYARLVEHHLDVAGIPWNGRPGTLVNERLIPRFLLDLLDLDRRGLRRTDLFDFLADVPVRAPSGGRVSVARWERLARAAGVTRDDHWQPRLASLAATLRARETPRLDEADAAEELAEFVEQLRRDLGHRRRTRSWADWADWCERQVQYRLGKQVLDQLDEAERLASDHASKVLDRLRHLDAISEPVSRSEFRLAFAAEFEVAPGRLGRLGNGVTIGSLSGTGGLDADLTIVLGAAEGLLPPAPATDPLITDADRRAAGLPTSDTQRHRIQRSFLAHLSTSTRVVIGVPRGDLRATTTRVPSRWLSEHAPDAHELVVASHRAGLLATTFPATPFEHRLRARAAASLDGSGALADTCAGDEVTQRGLRLRSARASATITEFDGDLSGVDIEHFTRPVSPSQLEAWRACPHAYFVRYLLGVTPLDDSGDEFALSPMERGNVVHETLDRFHQFVVEGSLAQPDESGWSAEHVDTLLALFDEVADEYERTGRTGRAAHWHLDRRAVRADLLTWFAHDGDLAADRRARVFHSELRFGYREPVTLPLPDGRHLAVAGFIDRVDETPDGIVVMDHKSGSAQRFAGVTSADPTEGGTKFQLPIYAAGALALRGEAVSTTTTAVRAEYDFFERAKYARIGYTFDEQVWARVTDDLGNVVEAIESGLYPNVTDPPKFEFYIGCHYCQPDGLGVDQRYREWVAKRHDPRIARWFPIDGGTAADAPTNAGGDDA